MDESEIMKQKDLLRRDIFVYDRGMPLLRDEFLHRSWEVLNSFTRYHKRNPLIAHAVKMYPDLVPRAYLILTSLFGTFTYLPSERDILRGFIDMLDGDLDEKELSVGEYVKDKENGFFPGLFPLMQKIREVYGAEHFNRDVLPPTPYHAYALIVLNHPEKITGEVSQEELFGLLAFHDSQLYKMLALAERRPTDPK